ncbi:MAG TPA: YibE/F family protein [Anaerolineales bacterium]|nr:YibE/F family protein [Anaerolineales bacterium]
MKNKLFLFFILIIVLLIAAFTVWGVPYFFAPQEQIKTIESFGSGTVLGEVTQIIEEGETTLGENPPQLYQIFRAKPLTGKYEGIEFELNNGKRQIRYDTIRLNVGDKLLMAITSGPQDTLNAYFVDYFRAPRLLLLGAIFITAILVMAKRKGLGALLGLAFSLFIVIGYIIPHILKGENPVTVSIVGSSILLSTTLYLTYGWNLKTHSAVISMIFSLIITGTLSWIFVYTTKLTGSGDENALFLVQMDTSINLRGLLLGGIIIGALGVLDDLVITQASALFEIHDANPNLGWRALYKRATNIGQDHVAATVNTLVMAYAGTALPMLLVFSMSKGNYGYIVNFSFVSEEIVRTLVGSLGLIAAVPITTLIAAYFAMNDEGFGALRPYLGKKNNGREHHH